MDHCEHPNCSKPLFKPLHKPHDFLKRKSRIYHAWHHHKHHKKVHWAALAVYVIAIGVVLFQSLNPKYSPPARASQTGVWNTTNLNTTTSFSDNDALEYDNETQKIQLKEKEFSQSDPVTTPFSSGTLSDEVNSKAILNQDGNVTLSTKTTGTYTSPVIDTGQVTNLSGLTFNSTSGITKLPALGNDVTGYASSYPYIMDVGDVDDDEDNDVVFTVNSNIYWLENSGDGTSYTTRTMSEDMGVGFEERVYKAKIVDVDNDGNNDLVFATSETDNNYAGLYLLKANSAQPPAFSFSTIISLANENFTCNYDNCMKKLAVADIDGDGFQDVVSFHVNSTNGAFFWVKNNGNGTFGTTLNTIRSNTNQEHPAFTMAFIDNDNRPDFVYLASDNLAWMKNNGGSPVTWAAPSSIDSGGSAWGTLNVVATDLDDDDDIDILSSTDGASSIKTYLNNGSGSFTASDELEAADYFSVGDMNGDGVKDIISHADSSSFKYYQGLGDGTFSNMISLNSYISLNNNIRTFELADMTGIDDSLDIVYLPSSGIMIKPTATGHYGSKAQIKACLNSDCSDAGSFVGPDGTDETYFTAESTTFSSPRSTRYYKYKATLETNSLYSLPVLSGVTVAGDYFSANNPYAYLSPPFEPENGYLYRLSNFSIDTDYGDDVYFQFSLDGGSTYYDLNGPEWTQATEGNINQAFTLGELTQYADTIPAALNLLAVPDPDSVQFVWLAIFNSDGSQQTDLSRVSIEYIEDGLPPDNVSDIHAYTDDSKITELNEDDWYNLSEVYFEWQEPTDRADDGVSTSGIGQYYISFSENAEDYQQEAVAFPYKLLPVVTGDGMPKNYYLRMYTADNDLNSSSLDTLMTIKIDKQAPTSPQYVSVTPQGYSKTNSFTFIVPSSGDGAASDCEVEGECAGISHYEYRIKKADNNYWPTEGWQETTNTSIPLIDKATKGQNIFYLRAVDNAGNEGNIIQTNFYYNADAPSAPKGLTATPSSSTTNSFAFNWNTPSSVNGAVAKYYYSINTLPTLAHSSTTTATHLDAGPWATQQGENVLYVLAEDTWGNVSFNSCNSITGDPDTDSCASVTFTATTPVPSAPDSLQIFDISNRDAKQYAITLKWVAPEDKGAGFDGYAIYRSLNGTSWGTPIGYNDGTNASTSYSDSGLESKQYYYMVKSKDNAGRYSAQSTIVNIIPTGKFILPPRLVGDVVATAKAYSATIRWTTADQDPTIVHKASSFVEYGTDPDHLGTENGGDTAAERSLVDSHTVSLTGLMPNNKTYYYQALWVDQDGNTGRSAVGTFNTAERPKATDVKIEDRTLNSVTISYQTTVEATTVINYGLDSKTLPAQYTNASGYLKDHTAIITNLNHSTKYYFTIGGTSSDGDLIDTGIIQNFETLTMPVILGEVGVDQDKDAPTTTYRFSWKTNIPTSSIIYYQKNGAQKQSKSQAETVSDHSLSISDLVDMSTYTFEVKGIDDNGIQVDNVYTKAINTPQDTRAPKISNLTVEIKSNGFGQTQKAQIIVSWQTDEMSTSQVEYGLGLSKSDYTGGSKEDMALSTNHVVILGGLEPSRIYHLRAISKDSSGNVGTSSDTTTITGRMQNSVVDIIVNSLQRSLGWVTKIFK